MAPGSTVASPLAQGTECPPRCSIATLLSVSTAWGPSQCPPALPCPLEPHGQLPGWHLLLRKDPDAPQLPRRRPEFLHGAPVLGPCLPRLFQATEPGPPHGGQYRAALTLDGAPGLSGTWGAPGHGASRYMGSAVPAPCREPAGHPLPFSGRDGVWAHSLGAIDGGFAALTLQCLA